MSQGAEIIIYIYIYIYIHNALLYVTGGRNSNEEGGSRAHYGMYICLCAFLYVHMYVKCVCVCIACTFVCKVVCVWYVHMFVCTYVCVCICLYMHMYVCKYVCKLSMCMGGTVLHTICVSVCVCIKLFSPYIHMCVCESNTPGMYMDEHYVCTCVYLFTEEGAVRMFTWMYSRMCVCVVYV
jgi:hypothetical protein